MPRHTLPPNSVRTDRTAFLLGGSGVLHHLGFAVQSISMAAEEFAASMSATWDRQVFYDPLQGVRVAFFLPVDTRNPVFELVEPARDASPVNNFLKRGGGLHHVCYEIDDLESGLADARNLGSVIVSPPKPAVAFGGRRIAWILSSKKARLLVELLERTAKSLGTTKPSDSLTTDLRK